MSGLAEAVEELGSHARLAEDREQRPHERNPRDPKDAAPATVHADDEERGRELDLANVRPLGPLPGDANGLVVDQQVRAERDVLAAVVRLPPRCRSHGIPRGERAQRAEQHEQRADTEQLADATAVLGTNAS